MYETHLTSDKKEMPSTKAMFTFEDMLLNYANHNYQLYCKVIEN